MSDYSTSPQDVLLANQQKGYVGLHIEQGVPLLDRDLNLLHDLISATIRSLIANYVGNGVAAGTDGFAIQPLVSPANTQNFLIAAASGKPGSILAGGIEVSIAADTNYASQAGALALTTPSPAQSNPRVDTVYLDVFFIEVDSTVDPDLGNALDVGMETSVRVKPAWIVSVAEGVPVPAAPAGHVYYPLAQLNRPLNVSTIDATMITDLRQRRLTVSNLEQRLSLLEKLVLLPAFANLRLQAQFIPRGGTIGQLITLYGTNFNVGSIQILFGAVPAAIVGAPSPTQVVVQVPPGLTPAGASVGVKLTVSNAGGSAVSDDTFTVLPNPAFAPPGGQFTPVHGTPGTQVTISGFNFNAGSLQVQFAGIAAVPSASTANQIVVPVPAGLVPAGSSSAGVKITIHTTAGTIVSDDTFLAEVSTPAPLFVAPPQFIPRSGVGNQAITLLGQNFNFPPVTVKFDVVNAIISGAPSATQIVAQVPPGMVAAGGSKVINITVTTAGGSVVSTDTFTVTGP